MRGCSCCGRARASNNTDRLFVRLLSEQMQSFSFGKKQRVKEQVSQYKHIAYISYPSIHRKKERKEIGISFSQQEHCTFFFSYSPSCNRVLQTYKPPFPLPRLPMKGASLCRRSQQNANWMTSLPFFWRMSRRIKLSSASPDFVSGRVQTERNNRKKHPQIRKHPERRKGEKSPPSPERAMVLALFPNIRTYCSFFRLVRFLFLLSEAIFEALDLFLDSSERLGLPTVFFPLSPTPAVATR